MKKTDRWGENDVKLKGMQDAQSSRMGQKKKKKKVGALNGRVSANQKKKH